MAGFSIMIEILADSINEHTGDRLTTVLIPRFWKPLQAELRTHRMFSQSHYSSRAIPVSKVIEQVQNDPYEPILTQYQKGMGGSDLDENTEKAARGHIWNLRYEALYSVKALHELGLAKQDANRYLEPWMHGACVVTGDQKAWMHFFELRCDEGVQPDMRATAESICNRMHQSEPVSLYEGDWHIPFFCEGMSGLSLEEQVKVSVARCARVSYSNHDGKVEYEKDYTLHNRLLKDKHMTPFEHQAVCRREPKQFANFNGFASYRYLIEHNVTIV